MYVKRTQKSRLSYPLPILQKSGTHCKAMSKDAEQEDVQDKRSRAERYRSRFRPCYYVYTMEMEEYMFQVDVSRCKLGTLNSKLCGSSMHECDSEFKATSNFVNSTQSIQNNEI